MARPRRRRSLYTVRCSRLRRSAASRWSVLILAFLALGALGIQNLVVQPHVHAQPSDKVLVLEISDGEDGLAGDVPIEQGQTDCPVCQSAHQNGQFLKPSAAVFALPALVNYRGIEFTQLSAAYEAVSHSWQGRAPPQA